MARAHSTYDVLGIGCCALDITFEVESYPQPDQKVRVPSFGMQGGGLMATALAAVARLGGSSAFIASLGEDSFAQFALDELRNEGVDVSHIRRVPDKSILTALIIADRSSGTRTVLFSEQHQPQTEPEQVTEELVSRARVLHVDNFQPEAAAKAAEIARSASIPVTMDLEMGGQEPDRLLELGDYAIVSLDFVRDRFGAENMQEGAQALFEEVAGHGGRAAVVTNGDQGAFLKSAGIEHFQPAYSVDVVDTTGCGDVFHGAFALGVAHEWDLKTVMRVSAATAGLKARKLGGRAGIPDMDEVTRFLENTHGAAWLTNSSDEGV